MKIVFKDINDKVTASYEKKRTTARDWLEATLFQERAEQRNNKMNEALLKIKSRSDSEEPLTDDDVSAIDASFSNKDVREGVLDGIDFLVKIYGKQFTKDEALDGLSPDEYNNAVNDAIEFALGGSGTQEEEKKPRSGTAKQQDELS
ncbi:phage tail assembly chaperone G [Listeria newyorkensis]|uniref:phage tail assembly chaperone G n=1 Tax=Listeria newyorkensis TaxID=1497681 RepID=UPI00051DB72F|nr:hypothetical protein [Listeria newyorkensis]KGL44128.1 hypothetical protein EP58_06675 [Listeria newyorkensis]SQC57696.1 Uncharacterised protein [Listeria newyorkensis]